MNGRLTYPERYSAGSSGSSWRKIEGAYHLAQPLETVLLQAVPATLFMRLAAPHGNPWRLLILFVAVIAIYGSVGARNDDCDYPLDEVAKPRKPLVRGLVTLPFALWQALILAVIGLLLSAALNWLTVCFSALILVLGICYDIRAKRSLLSWVPYAALAVVIGLAWVASLPRI